MKKLIKLIPAITSLGLIATPIITLSSCSNNNYNLKTMSVVKEDGSEEFSTKIMYVTGSSIPYIGLNEAFTLNKKIHKNYVHDDVYNFEVKNNYNSFVVKRENGATMTFDSYNNTITFDDYNLFMCEGTSKPSSCARDYGVYGKHTDTNITSILAWGDIDVRVRREEKTVMNLSLYGINMFEFNNELYLPFQTFNDIFFSDTYRPLFVLKDIIFCPWDFRHKTGVVPTYPDFITKNKITVDQELLTFNYKETCFFMDYAYGLMSEKGVSTFDSLFRSNGWKDRMLKSVKDFENALNEVIGYFMDDGHSNYRWRSPMSDDTSTFNPIWGPCGQLRNSESDRYEELRHKTYPLTPGTEPKETFPAYVVPNQHKDTAVITFDSFNNKDVNYYESGALPEDPNKAVDCIGLFLSSYKKISADTNIKNVIVDISNNGGGDVKACMIISAMLAGGEFKNVWKSTVDESVNVCGYYTDANLDGKIDSADFAFKDKNVYILTSTYSFSCANMLPTNLFQLPNCHIVGKRSGGGACIVHPAANAIGTGFRMSGPMKHGYLKNGVFYYNDEGIEPEYYINDDMYYRKGVNDEPREDLITYIKSLQ